MPSPTRIALYTSALVALLNGEVDRGEHVPAARKRAEEGQIQLYVSTVTITEITKGPKATDVPLTADQERTFTDFMDNDFVTMVSVDPVVATRARDLRRSVPKLKTPDALVVATALVAQAERLYTYDTDDLVPLSGQPDVDGLVIALPPIEEIPMDLWSLAGEPGGGSPD